MYVSPCEYPADEEALYVVIHRLHARSNRDAQVQYHAHTDYNNQ